MVKTKQNNSYLLALSKEILFFPIWWYSFGLKNTFLNIVEMLGEKEKTIGLSLWLKNLFKPMFGQQDWQGKLISFMLRLFFLLVKSLQMLFWLVFELILLIIYIVLPIFIVYQLIINLL